MTMENEFKIQLLAKNILVNDTNRNENVFETLFAFSKKLNIKIVEGRELADLAIFKFAASQLGEYVPKPFYEGFPKSVRGLTTNQLVFDQLLNYAITYGFGNFEDPRHSIFEKEYARIGFKEKTKIKEFVIVDESTALKELEGIVENLLLSSRPLSLSQYSLVKNFILIYGYNVKECNCKETLIRLLIDTRNAEYMKFLHLNDVVEVVRLMQYYKYSSDNVNNLNLKNQDRKFISNIIDIALSGGFSIKDCYEKQKIWQGILHHIHYKPKSDKAIDFVNKMRSSANGSVFSVFKRMLGEDVKGAIDYLTKQKGTALVIRNLNYIISRCKDLQDVEYVMNNIKTKNNIILIQNLLQYHHYNVASRTFKFTRFNKLKVHRETDDEIQKRKSVIKSEYIQKVVELLKKNLEENLKGRLGKVFIDKGLENIALPIQETASMSGFGVLPKGSKLIIDDGKKVRAFMYWEKVDDIDLSMIGLNEALKQKEFSWRTMNAHQSNAITFSGDVTNGYYGGCEYFDIDLEEFEKLYPDIRYLVTSANVYSRSPFSSCKCKAGYMLRDKEDSGEIFEPRTVDTSFAINTKSTFAYLFAIDIQNRQIIWLNVARDSSIMVAGTTQFGFILDYLDMCDVINLKDFATMLASEVVKTKKDADVIFTDKLLKVKDKQVIRIYDVDKIIALMN